MTQKHRISFLLLALLTLLAVGFAVTGSFRFIVSDFWFSAGLLMLILLSIVDQPHFSRDANIFVNGVAGLLSLQTVAPDARTYLWYLFLTWALYLVVSSVIIMLVRSRELPRERTVVQLVSRLNRQIGRPQALFSAFFLWGIYTQFGEGATAFRALLLYWAIFMILNIPAVARTIATALEQGEVTKGSAQGIITAFLSPRVFECRLSSEIPRLNPGTKVEVYARHGRLAASATVVDDRIFPGERFLKLAATERTKDWGRLADPKTVGVIEVSITPETNGSESEPIGVVDRGSDIGNLRLLVNPESHLEKGEVLSVNLPSSGKEAYYQIVSGKVLQEKFESSHEMHFVEVTAGQLGLWHARRSRFEPVNWVAPAGGLVFKLSGSHKVDYKIPHSSVELGSVPNANFPVHLDLEDAVTHNTALVGVTGSGKTYLALHVIEALLSRNIKVLVLDISRQHWIFLKENDPFAVRRVDEIEEWLEGNQALAIHQFADADNYPARTAQLVGRVFQKLEQSTQLRAGENEPARICVVLEEAHSLVPEWNQVAQQGDTAQVNRTARTILQGRKYGLGCLLITQRTANVTKTILNQCNTIFALQSFDQTGLDFLKNYMGDEYAHAISTMPTRHAILVGKASSSTRPILFEISDFGDRWTEDNGEAGEATQ